ncbi:MAG TPA: sigma-70 family RNA polymerase sigma factor [Gammaproteobacteria bacterium]|nr:sigma-70 family RNA polymerase sigma factor [Gammaproteobacteria bacterium]
MPETDPYAELLRLCAQGDQKAFARLYTLTSPKLFSLCLRMMKSRQAAEEVLQEGFVKIWTRSGTFDRRKASAMTWMTTVVRNRALDVIRSKKSRPVEVDMEYEGMDFAADDLTPVETTGMNWSAERVAVCMRELKPQQRRSILMAYYYGFTHEEISKKLEAPLGTVKAWVRRGIDRLRRCLE